jgi:tRNA pseudouridine55 synthase
MQGILLVDKPAGWTSFDVVNYVRRIVATVEGKKPKNCKVGHTGTLDPFATGLLIIMVGKGYTRKASEFSKMDKTYEVTIRLGQTSTTGDPEGVIAPYVPLFISTEVEKSVTTEDKQISRQARDDSGVVEPSREEVEEAVNHFKGQIQQTPPAYSAIKIDGQRAYKLAREGKEVIIEPRTVTINSLEIADYTYPELKLVADVSSGTYIRTLAEDIGKKLEVGAYTTTLRRTVVGNYSVDQAVQVSQLDQQLLLKEMQK